MSILPIVITSRTLHDLLLDLLGHYDVHDHNHHGHHDPYTTTTTATTLSNKYRFELVDPVRYESQEDSQEALETRENVSAKMGDLHLIKFVSEIPAKVQKCVLAVPMFYHIDNNCHLALRSSYTLLNTTKSVLDLLSCWTRKTPVVDITVISLSYIRINSYVPKFPLQNQNE